MCASVKEVLATTSDAYRKLRNTFRYLLGALEGFSEEERVPLADMPELERYILHLLAALDIELRSATDAFEFNRYARALTDFAQCGSLGFLFRHPQGQPILRYWPIRAAGHAQAPRLSHHARYPVPGASALRCSDPLLHGGGGLGDALS